MSKRFRLISIDTKWTFTSRNWAYLATMAIVAILLLSPAWKAAAQSAGNFDTGTITGTVTDPTGAVIPHASVTITNTGTGNVTTATTGDSGLFTAPALPFGNYVVSASADRFGKAASSPFVLNVGATTRVDLKLSLAAVSEKVEVTGTMATVNLSNATAGTTLNENQIENLPTNGRDVMDFLNIAPGSDNSTGYFQGSVNGQENFMTGIEVTLDGQNASRPDISGFDETEGAEANRMTRASVDSIQEIDFANSGYSADVGHSLGPQMNIITKGGTNKYHGEVFEFFRNDALDALDYFASSLTQPKVPLRMNQFGGNLGGPLAKNKLFFFANYEGLQQKTTQINKLNTTLSAYVRSQFNSAMQPVLAQMEPLPANCQGIVGEPGYPGTCSYPINANGTPTYEDEDIFGDLLPQNGSDLVYAPTALPTTVSENSGAVRVDYTPTSNDRIFGRYTIDNGLTNETYGPNEGQIAPEALVNQYGVVDETHTFTPTLINEISVAIQKFHSDTNSNTPQPLVGFSGFFTNLGSLPSPNTFNQINDDSTFDIFDNATKTAGSWTFKFGPQIQFNRLGEWLRPQQTFEFGSFDSLEADQPFILSKIGFPSFFGVRNSNWDLYGEGDWRANSRLTINLGLRLDVNTAWSDRNHLQQNFDFKTQSFLSPNQPLYGTTVDAAPRVGLNYDPFGHGKTVIHAYYGLFYLPLQFGANFVANNPAYQSYSVNVFQVSSLAYPEANPTLPAGTQNVSIMPSDVHDAYSDNWLFGVQQEVARDTVLTVNYVGNEDQRMQAGQNFAAVNLNPANWITDSGRPYSGFANENLEACELSGSYHSLQAGVRHNVGKLNYEANYTWSHTINDFVNFLNNPSDPYDLKKDMGNADVDVRHNFTASMTYNFPELNGSNLFERTALGGWQTSSIVQTRSGDALNPTIVGTFFGLPTRPNFTGASIRKSGGSWPNGVYNTAGYEVEPNFNGNPGDPSTLGNVPRNSLPGPAFFQWDFSGMKNFPVTEKIKVQFRGDLFNILNHPNFGNPTDMGICTAIGTIPGTTTESCAGSTPTSTNYN
ncbi:MAG: carboxypeptidase regulatory-like domain-containing protein, partial [Terracidiphilus sp.]